MTWNNHGSLKPTHTLPQTVLGCCMVTVFFLTKMSQYNCKWFRGFMIKQFTVLMNSIRIWFWKRLARPNSTNGFKKWPRSRCVWNWKIQRGAPPNSLLNTRIMNHHWLFMVLVFANMLRQTNHYSKIHQLCTCICLITKTFKNMILMFFDCWNMYCS